jgi:hypothetical protein
MHRIGTDEEDDDLKGCQEQPLWQYVACDRLVGKESNLQFVEREGWVYCHKMISGLQRDLIIYDP